MAAEGDTVDPKVVAEGFTTVAEMVDAYRKAVAATKQATDARDKFAADIEGLKKLLREKAGEIGALKQEIEELKIAPTAPPPKRAAPPAPEPEDIETRLKAVESRVSEELWKIVDGQLVPAMSVEEATAIAEDKKTRVEFLEGLLKDPDYAAVAKPKSLRPNAAPARTVEEGKSVYERIKGRRPAGPGAHVRVPGSTRDTQQASWLN
jgi:hypothetical protein